MTSAPPRTASTTRVTASTISPQRQVLVERACEGWIRRLVDRSRNNNLLYYRDLKTGTLDLSKAQPLVLAQLLGGTAVRIDHLLPNTPTNRPSAQARHIQQRARANQEEKGIASLFLAFGMATWRIGDGGRPPTAPVLLFPVTLELISREGPVLTIERAGDVQINRVLIDELNTYYACRIDPDTLLSEDVEKQDDVRAIFARLRVSTREVADFDVVERVILGNFSFLKLAIVQDLHEGGDLLAGHDVIAALAGAEDARAAILRNREPIDLRSLDQIAPEQEFLVLDADSSQQRVIAAVLQGQHGVIQGPPGTGKSQTIANLIASLVAQGQRVLFVAEKRAALEVVQRRLEHVGLGHLALDLHGADVARSTVIGRFAENLDMVRASLPVDATAIHQPFSDRRSRLNQHVVKIHDPRPPFGLSVYTIQGRLLRIPLEARTTTRWRGEQIARLDSATVAALSDVLVELGGLEDLFCHHSQSPWAYATINNGASAQSAIDTVSRLTHELLPDLRASLADIACLTRIPAAKDLAGTATTLSLLGDVATILGVYKIDVFQTDLATLSEHLTRARHGVLAAGFEFLVNNAYREAERRASEFRLKPTGVFERGPTLAAEIERAAELVRRWQEIAPPQSRPVPYPQLDRVGSQLAAVRAALGELGTWLNVGDWQNESFDELARRLAALNCDSHSAYRVARVNELLAAIHQQGAGALLDELQASKTPSELWPQQLEHAWLSSCLDYILGHDTQLAGFSGAVHTRFADEFRSLDVSRLDIAAGRVLRAHAERVIAAMNAHPDQEDLVRREAAKRKRHLPLRTLIARAPQVLTTLCPCWMASPLSISQLVDARHSAFDIVIFDEASQVLPEDAVAALMRGRQVVVAGDRYQLPPTRFFVSSDDEDAADDVAPTEGFESLLDLLSAQLDSWSLNWHYRSRDESLIAFSNRYIYSDRLVTFPGAVAAGAIRHEQVVPTSGVDGQEESSSTEVARVVELVLDHAATRPDETLGVITMGIKHALRIEAALDDALRRRPELEQFFATGGAEPFFVKNLERVQGDERDAVILTIGYGKDRSGKLPYRFGPLLTTGGERRLNVAVTRARRRLTLVSSFSHMDMDPDRSQACGVELLRRYLEYAASGGRHLNSSGTTSVPLNPFEADVYDALSAAGMPLLPQWGVSRYRLDFAAQHRDRPGQFVLAIECDGATYHSAPTARDRDRLRQQHLEALGWHFHRIWSQDWFHRRTDEIRRAVQAYEVAVQEANNPMSVPNSAVRDKSEPMPKKPAPPSHQIRTRGPRPNVWSYQPITHYSHTELVALVRWIKSDGQLRSDDELVGELVKELGFQRRGPRIIAALRSAIDAAKP